jgi:MFS family permease
MVQPAVGLILGSAVSPRRLSLASGLIQAALAAPPLSAGLLVRFLAQPYGWRAALSVGGALVALSALASAFARDRSRSRKDSGISEPPATGGENASLATPSKAAGGRVLLLWSVGGALGTVGVTATAAFFVPIATRSGFPAATAGLLALCAGALAAIVRVGAGAIADLRPRANLPAVVGMMLSGSGGLAVIAVGLSMGTPATFLVGAVVLERTVDRLRRPAVAGQPSPLPGRLAGRLLLRGDGGPAPLRGTERKHGKAASPSWRSSRGTSDDHATALPSLERHAERFEKGSLLNLVPIVSDPHHLVATNAADNL